MTEKQRIIEVVKFSGMAQSAFAKAIGVSTTALYLAIDESKERQPGAKIHRAILEYYPNLNANWLIKGEGEMWLKDKEEMTPDELNEALKKQVAAYEYLIRRELPDVARELGLLDD